MRKEEYYPKETRQLLAEIGRADIVVGVPSYNNAKTIGHVVRAVNAGLTKYFPDHKAVLVNSDGGSKDGTPEIVKSAEHDGSRVLLTHHPMQTIHRIVTPYLGLPGKGSALRTVFAVARELDAKACAVVDSDLRSISPEWIELLIGPVLTRGFDFVSPLYHRHKYDGTITNSIVYPMTRALYGKRVRQPIGGDFGFSGRMASHYLEQDVWLTDVARFGIDIWMTTTAIVGGFSVCQSFLGAKIHDAKDPGTDLSSMLVQVVSSVFDLMGNNADRWMNVSETQPVPAFGFEYTVGLEPINVNVERMVDRFGLARRELKPLWEKILDPATFGMVMSLPERAEGFEFPVEIWVKTVYDFALAYHHRTLNRDHILSALTPLYLARTASFVLETPHADAEESERIIEQVCLEYEREKPYLTARWTGKRS